MTSLEQLDRMILLCRDYISDSVADEAICRCFQSVRVLCLSDLPNLSSHSGQTALMTLVSLLTRMGMQVELAVPDIAMIGQQLPFSGDSVKDALLRSNGTMIEGSSVRNTSGARPDLMFILGDTKPLDFDVPCWCLCGENWVGKLRNRNSSDANRWLSQWPIGAMVSALLAANEAFKSVMRGLPFRMREDTVFFEPSSSCCFDFGAIPLPDWQTDKIDLGIVDMISAGAITQAALFALLRIPNVSMLGRIFDDDVTGPSNLNRNMLSLADDVGSPKVFVVAERCRPKLRIEPIVHRFARQVSRFTGLAPRVLVGVDDIPSRWEVQRESSQWLAVSGTSHFSVSSSTHEPSQPCCGCLHPVDDPGGSNPIPTVSFVSFWAGLAMAVRLLRDVLDRPYPRERQHLWMTPLRMDLPNSAMWTPVAARRDCPVLCEAASRQHGPQSA